MSQEQIEENVNNDGTDISEEELNNLSDDEFNEWLETGKYNNQQQQEEQPVEEEQPKEEEKPVEEEKQVEEEKKPTEEEKPAEVDYKAFYEAITKPFKANGREIQVSNVQDVISMMQQGANYTKKMQKLKPLQKSAESLIRAGISDERLAFLIDLHKGDKNAIKRLLKDNKIDPTDIDTEEEDTYKPNIGNLATDEQVQFQNALLDIPENDMPKIRDILEKQWDSKSSNTILNNPKLLRDLAYEVTSGRFDKVQSLVETERTFGRYTDISDLEAYQAVGNAMLMREMSNAQAAINNTNVNSNNSNDKSKHDKRKASPSKGKSTPSKASMTPEDLMEMSDEDFLKLNEKDFY